MADQGDAATGPDGQVELNAVVTPDRHNQGTGNSGIGQLAFYQKAGFRLWRVERDFFSPERGYPEGIEENGIPLRDMVWMDVELK